MWILRLTMCLVALLLLSSRNASPSDTTSAGERPALCLIEEEAEPQKPEVVSYMEKYISKYKTSPKVDEAAVAALFYEKALLVTETDEQAACIALCAMAHARPESGFKSWTKGSAGEMGELQIHPTHTRSMKKAGLSFSENDDRILWGFMMIAGRIASGIKSGSSKLLYRAMSPWTTRDRGNGSGPAGWGEFKKLYKDYSGKDYSDDIWK